MYKAGSGCRGFLAFLGIKEKPQSLLLMISLNYAENYKSQPPKTRFCMLKKRFYVVFQK